LLNLDSTQENKEEAVLSLIIKYCLNLNSQQIIAALDNFSYYFNNKNATIYFNNENHKYFNNSINHILEKTLDLNSNIFVALILALNNTISSGARALFCLNVLQTLSLLDSNNFIFTRAEEALPILDEKYVKKRSKQISFCVHCALHEDTKINVYMYLLRHYYFDLSNFKLESSSKAFLLKYSSELYPGRYVKRAC